MFETTVNKNKEIHCFSDENQNEIQMMFNLSREIFCGELLSEKSRGYLEQIFPEPGLFILLDRNGYLHPGNLAPIPMEVIWETVRNDMAGIFRCRIGHSRHGETDGICLATSLGKTKNGNDIAAGLIYSDRWDTRQEGEDNFYRSMARLKRYYGDFATSESVGSFINGDFPFAYIIDPHSRQIVCRHIPSSDISDIEIFPWDNLVVENFLKRALSPETEADDKIAIDEKIENIKISKFKINDYEYILLSFQVAHRHQFDILQSERNKFLATSESSASLIEEEFY
ncbi:MAG: hypothetical protein NTV06_05440 [candidate division Zixibacteria bacterium]|nr:hypothetical protein [candidate division Zixibacteria bacterium]